MTIARNNAGGAGGTELELRYHALIEQSPDGILLIDMKGNFLDFNSKAHLQLGYTREEFAKLRISDIDPVESPEEIERKIAAIVRMGRAEFEVKHRTREGEIRDVLIINQALVLSGQTLIHSIWRDITGSKQAEERLQKSEKFIRTILETVDEGFIVVDRDYRILSANKAYLDGLNAAKGDVIGKPCYSLAHRLSRPCHEVGVSCAVRQAFETGKPAFAEHLHTNAAGDSFHVELKAYPVFDASGNVISAVETVTDITERRRLEDQLRQAQKMEAIGQLAGGVAHDFNNILTAVIGYGHILRMKMPAGDPLLVNVEHVLDSANRAARLTHSLLAFSRKQILAPKPVDLNEIILRVDALLRRIIGEDIELRTSLRPEALTINADSGQIEQVLMNLAANARDAMPRGGAFTIETSILELDHAFIRVHGYGEAGRYAVMSVTDTGRGMDEETRKRIFEPFFTTKEVGKGTGLGLAILYGIVKHHRGHVNAYSEPGRGTTFKIYLPLLEREGVNREAPCRVPGAEIPRGSETVLVAEDDETLRRLSKTILEEFGYAVIEAENGADAVARFREHESRIGLVILDMIMPKMNGREAYEELKRIRPGVKALFVSGYTADKIRADGLLAHGVELILKPVSPVELLKRVRERLDKK